MEYLFALEKMAELFKEYYNVTHIRIAFLDLNHQDILGYPLKRSPICDYIRKNIEAERCCFECDKNACAISKRKGTAYSYECHAGLFEVIVPLKIRNNIVGYLFFSHMLKGNNKKEAIDNIILKTKRFNLDSNELYKLSENLDVLKEDYINSAVYLLNTIATYLCMEEQGLIKEKDSLSLEIEKYIYNNLNENIQIQDACKALGIGKTKLCVLSQKYFNESFHQHVLKIKLDYAKKLLIENNLSISEIALDCGFQDYNYFIYTFRKKVGISPYKYKKMNNI